MTKEWSYKAGEWNAICDVCGFKFKSSEMKERWDGAMVCKDDWETRHPQDLYKYKNHEKAPDWVRPQQPDVFVTVNYVSGSVGTQDNDVPDSTFNITDPIGNS